MSSKTLIRGGCVLTLGPRTPNFANADVLIDEGKVVEVAPGLRARDAEVIDATDTIVMPGFVDTHRHVWKSLFRNYGDGGQESAGPGTWGRHYQPEDVYAATLIGLLGAIEAGITTVVDWADLQFDKRWTDATLQAHADAGVRTVLVYAPLPGDAPDDDLKAALGRLGPAPRTVAYGSTDPFTAEGVTGNWGLARELGLRIHSHTGPNPGMVSALGGLLGADVTLIHCFNLDEGDLHAVSSRGVSVALSPSAEMASGSGPPPIQKLLDRNIRPGLGIDNEQIAPGDMFAQMRTAISLQHASYFDLKLAGKAGLPNLLTTRDVIRYATVDGAKVAGLGGLTGSLEPGKQADLVVLRADRPNIAPINDPIGAVVWGMDTSNVDWVFVNGRALMRNGVVEGDVQGARKLAVEAQRRVATAAGQMAAAG
ncbi:MAG TPA: amidohydrolase family protein, partial [Acidimicrobiia bacterium]|nr:amidohydrolase family protein [Acidimicrobiia bacterium]